VANSIRNFKLELEAKCFQRVVPLPPVYDDGNGENGRIDQASSNDNALSSDFLN